MGTNYYITDGAGEKIHIGKMSACWRFHHNVITFDAPTRNSEEWRFIVSLFNNVEDEYGLRVDTDIFFDIIDFIQDRKSFRDCDCPYEEHEDNDEQWLDENGFWFSNYEFC